MMIGFGLVRSPPYEIVSLTDSLTVGGYVSSMNTATIERLPPGIRPRWNGH
jgi:hypothetical protein